MKEECHLHSRRMSSWRKTVIPEEFQRASLCVYSEELHNKALFSSKNLFTWSHHSFRLMSHVSWKLSRNIMPSVKKNSYSCLHFSVCVCQDSVNTLAGETHTTHQPSPPKYKRSKACLLAVSEWEWVKCLMARGTAICHSRWFGMSCWI